MTVAAGCCSSSEPWRESEGQTLASLGTLACWARNSAAWKTALEKRMERDMSPAKEVTAEKRGA